MQILLYTFVTTLISASSHFKRLISKFTTELHCIRVFFNSLQSLTCGTYLMSVMVSFT